MCVCVFSRGGKLKLGEWVVGKWGVREFGEVRRAEGEPRVFSPERKH